MKLRLSSLKQGVQTIESSIKPSALGIQDDNFQDDSQIKLSIDKGEREIYINAHIQTTANFVCDRCVQPFKQKIAGQVTIILTPTATTDQDKEEDNVITISEGMDFVDISSQLRDALLLEVPMKKLCDSQCQGLCPHCGVNLNHQECDCSEIEFDPRWDKLRQLRKKMIKE